MAFNDEELASIAAGKAMLELLDHRAWKLYVKAIEFAIAHRTQQLEVPAGSIEDALVQNYTKGAVSGLRLALSMPAYTVAEMKLLQEKAQEATDEEDDDDGS